MNDGRELEYFVERVYSALLQNENLKKSNIKKNHTVIGRSQVKHQFDVYYEIEIANNLHRVAIECKQHNRRITKGLVQEFKAKIEDCNNVMGVMVTSEGYQTGAKEFAEFYGIKCITVEELPNIFEIISLGIKVLLPDENAEGKPFWVIMETHGETNTGSYYSHDGISVMLFNSKKAAEMAIVIGKLESVNVFGVTKSHLRAICAFCKVFGYKINICPFLSDIIKEHGIVAWKYSHDQIVSEFELDPL